MIVYRRVTIQSPLETAEALASLERAMRSLSELRGFGRVESWTVFGDTTGRLIRAQAAGPFGGWSSRSGYGLWQPSFRGAITAEKGGTVLVGEIRGRAGWIAFVGLILVVGVALLAAMLPRIVDAVAAGRPANAVAESTFLGATVGIPWLVTGFLIRLASREAGAVEQFLRAALGAEGPSGP